MAACALPAAPAGAAGFALDQDLTGSRLLDADTRAAPCRHVHRPDARRQPHRHVPPRPRSASGRQRERDGGAGLRRRLQRRDQTRNHRRSADPRHPRRRHQRLARPAAPPAGEGQAAAQPAACAAEVRAAWAHPGQHGPGHHSRHQGPPHSRHQPAGRALARSAGGLSALVAKFRRPRRASRKRAANMRLLQFRKAYRRWSISRSATTIGGLRTYRAYASERYGARSAQHRASRRRLCAHLHRRYPAARGPGSGCAAGFRRCSDGSRQPAPLPGRGGKERHQAEVRKARWR